MTNIKDLNKSLVQNSKKIQKRPSLIEPRFLVSDNPKNAPLAGPSFLNVHFDMFTYSALASTKVGDIVDAILRGQIYVYNNNRGSGKVKEKWILEKSEKFHIDGFGMIVLVNMGHNSYRVNEGHSRLQTLMYMRQIGVLKKFENLVLPIQIVKDHDQFMEVYRTTNTNHPHLISDKLSNVDYGLGKQVDFFLKTLNNAKYRGVNIVKDGHLKQVGLLLYGTTLKNVSEIDFKDLTQRSDEVTALANLLPEEFTLHFTSQNKTRLKDAINFTLDVMREVIDLTDLKSGTSGEASLSKIGNKIVGNAMFFSLISWDGYSNSGDLTQIDAKRIAKNLVNKAAWTSTTLTLLASKSTMYDAMQSFYEIIRTKKKND